MNPDILYNLLVGGLDDYADMAWIIQDVREAWPSANSEEEQEKVVTVIAELLRDGLMIPGTLKGGQFAEIPGTPRDQLEFIVQSWERDWNYGWPDPGGVSWFANTELGNKRARRLMAERRTAQENSKT